MEPTTIHITIPVTLDPQFLHDVFVTALEGGIGYWSDCHEYRWSLGAPSHEADLVGFYATVVDAEGDDDTVHRIDRPAIVRGVERILTGQATCCGKPIGSHLVGTVARAVVGGDAGDIDAEIADVIVQIGLFGEIVYG